MTNPDVPEQTGYNTSWASYNLTGKHENFTVEMQKEAISYVVTIVDNGATDLTAMQGISTYNVENTTFTYTIETETIALPAIAKTDANFIKGLMETIRILQQSQKKQLEILQLMLFGIHFCF